MILHIAGLLRQLVSSEKTQKVLLCVCVNLGSGVEEFDEGQHDPRILPSVTLLCLADCSLEIKTNYAPTFSLCHFVNFVRTLIFYDYLLMYSVGTENLSHIREHQPSPDAHWLISCCINTFNNFPMRSNC